MREHRGLLLVACVILAIGVLGSSCSPQKTEEAKKPAYPDQPLTFIAPANPGGGWDLTCRATAKVLQDTGLVKVPITVTNQPGGFGATAMADIVNNRRKDNYVLVAFSTVLTSRMALGDYPFSYKDITPVAALFVDYGTIGVKADAPYRGMADLLEALRKSPDSISFAGSSPPGGLDHVRVARLGKLVGIDPKKVRYVAFQGGADAIAAVMGGHATAFVGDAGEIAGYTEAHALRPLVVLGKERLSGIYADTPSSSEAGIDLISGNWRGFYAPPEVSQDVLQYWVTMLHQMVETSAWKEALQKYSWQPFLLTGDKLKAFLEDELNTYRNTLKELGLGK
ncbi:MAG: tripartite tricarboxylate transporter substrate-binding protein [Bacillota bacterium]|nr:tripartite tricarboxylate transporter substrate-binding protein [Bacillota bacterium]